MVIASLIILERKMRVMGFTSYFIMWFSYYCLVNPGQVFLSFQWDIMLIEIGFLAMFLCPKASSNGGLYSDIVNVLARELLKWFLFRLMFATGVVKH
jgi:hypothetical protein